MSAPIIGGRLFETFGRRSIFWFLAAVRLILVIAVGRFLRETLPEEFRHSFHPRALMHCYREVAASRPFLLLSLAMGFNFNAFFRYILSAPVFQSTHLQLEPTQCSGLFIPSIAGILVGAQLSGPLAVFHDPRWMAVATAAMMLTGFTCWRLYCAAGRRTD